MDHAIPEITTGKLLLPAISGKSLTSRHVQRSPSGFSSRSIGITRGDRNRLATLLRRFRGIILALAI
jgi:hypothetical protein